MAQRYCKDCTIKNRIVFCKEDKNKSTLSYIWCSVTHS